ncbi:hypothetical protein AB1Y20_004177 [Prymnesium parvum]|uniref:Uncharacterized protein n=1 Tax=Prymnesium parvum TaxID=97485 RepID=A0AB34J760_PRYPA
MSSVKYINCASGWFASYFVRSDGSVDRYVKGKVVQRLVPPQGVQYTQASAGTTASFLLRSDGAVDRIVGKQAEIDGTMAPEVKGKSFLNLFSGSIKYVAVSASGGPTYLMRSDGKVDLARSGEVVETMESGPYQEVSGGSDFSLLLKADGSIDRIFAFGKIGHTFPPSPATYTKISNQYISEPQDIFASGAPSHFYFIRADGKVDRVSIKSNTIGSTMDPPAGTKYVYISSYEGATYLLRSDGVVDRTTGGGKIANSMSPPPGVQYTLVAAGEYATYLVRSDGMIDRTKGSGKVSETISPEVVPDPSGGCSVM